MAGRLSACNVHIANRTVLPLHFPERSDHRPPTRDCDRALPGAEEPAVTIATTLASTSAPTTVATTVATAVAAAVASAVVAGTKPATGGSDRHTRVTTDPPPAPSSLCASAVATAVAASAVAATAVASAAVAASALAASTITTAIASTITTTILTRWVCNCHAIEAEFTSPLACKMVLRIEEG